MLLKFINNTARSVRVGQNSEYSGIIDIWWKLQGRKFQNIEIRDTLKPGS